LRKSKPEGSVDLEGKWKPILIGGLITGLAPFVPFLNLACCLIPLLGAIAAVAVYRSSATPPTLITNDGVVLGAMSGLVGTVVYAVLVVPLTIFVGSALGGFLGRLTPELTDVPAGLRPLLEEIFNNFGSFLGVILFVKVLSMLALCLIFGVIGGLIGVAILKPKTPAPPPIEPSAH
jgi:hypothetical protein